MRAIHVFIVLILITGLHGSSKAAEPCCGTEMTRADEAATGYDDRAIIRAIEGYAKGFIQRDVGLLMSLWDARNADEVSYVAVELDQPLIGLQNMRPYYLSFLNSPFTVYSGDVTDVRIFQKGDKAYVFCHFNWVYLTGPGGQVLEKPTRATFVLRRSEGRWLYEHFHESILFEPEPNSHR